MNKVTIYTDGACSGNPGEGGWGAVLIAQATNGRIERHISGYEKETTNNRMELMGVISALMCLTVTPCELTIYTDSAYIVNAFANRWYENWQTNGWRTSKKEPVANIDLWEKLLNLLALNPKYSFVKVKGHNGDVYNEICDNLATGAIKAQKGIDTYIKK